jgi:hypothetical protein
MTSFALSYSSFEDNQESQISIRSFNEALSAAEVIPFQTRSDVLQTNLSRRIP